MSEISNHFEGLYPLMIAGSLVFHLVYGTLLGFLAGRMTELRVLNGNSQSIPLQAIEINDVNKEAILIRDRKAR